MPVDEPAIVPAPPAVAPVPDVTPFAKSASLEQARLEWERVLGPDHVIADAAARRRRELATFASPQRVPLILRPDSRGQIQNCLTIANRHAIPVYPVSSGKNWGYGSSAPAGSGVLMDLSRLNRIVDFDEKLAYVTVEPGVTQRQLFEFLSQRGSKLWMDATGASPDCSLIGNTMERGFGHTPYGDHFGHVCGLEVVLPTGECIETGFARYRGAKAASVYRWGVGPSLDGLFSQSNLGVVTRMTIWLMPAPECFEAFFFRCESEEALGEVVEAIRPLRLNGTLRSAMHIANDYKVLSAIGQYPWKEMENRTPLSSDVMARCRKELNLGVWNGSGGLYGSKAQVREARRLLRKALKGKVSRLQILNDGLLRLAARFARPYGWVTGWDISRAVELARPVMGLMRGEPTDHAMKSVYWRKRMAASRPADPERDGCGLLWCGAVAPADGASTREMNAIACRVLLEAGFEPAISMTYLTDRAVTSVVSIAYDRAVPGEDDRALRCYNVLVSELESRGYLPYRLGIQSMSVMSCGSPYEDSLRRLKRAFDPNGVLAPARYGVSG